jgi:membrane protein YdbS with pleckstrin-like domain
MFKCTSNVNHTLNTDMQMMQCHTTVVVTVSVIGTGTVAILLVLTVSFIGTGTVAILLVVTVSVIGTGTVYLYRYRCCRHASWT